MPAGTRTFVVALVLFALSASTTRGALPPVEFPDGKTEVRIPLQRGGSYLLVPVKINGKDAGLFIVDTGMSMITVDRKFAAQWNLPTTSVSSTLSVNKTLKVETVAVSELEIGQVKAQEIFLMTTDLSAIHSQAINLPVNGILGMSGFLARMSITINWSQAQLTLYRDRAPENPNATKLPLIDDTDCPIVYTTIGGVVRGPFMLDTGSNGGFGLNFAESTFHRTWLTTLQWRSSMLGNLAGLQDARTVSIEESLVGSVPIGKSELSYVVKPGSETTRSSLIGQRILRNFEVTVDMGAKAAWLTPDPAQGVPAEWSKEGFDPKSQDAFGITPLMKAISLKNPALISRFLSAGGDLNTRDAQGMTALHLACVNDDAATAEKLLAAGAEVDVRNGLDRTPLHLAAAEDAADVVKLLLAKSAKVDLEDSTGQTSLILAADTGSREVIQLLIQAGANLNIVSAKSGSALNIAAANGRAEALKALLDAGADLTRTNRLREPLLLTAASGESPQVVQMLLDRKVAINSTDAVGHTPLMAAARNTNLDVVRLLLSHGADPMLKDKQDWRAIDYAAQSNGSADVMHELYYASQPTTAPSAAARP